MALTVSRLVQDIRNQLDELNRTGISDERDILPSLNRGKDYGLDIVTRVWEPALLTNISITAEGDTVDFPVPSDAFEGRIEHVELEYQQNYFRHLTPANFREITVLEGVGGSSYPTHWCMIGDSIRILPRPAAGTPLRIWYSRDIGELVPEQGRLVQTPALGQTYLICNEVLDGISEDITSQSSFFNVIDGQTGAIRGTFQVAYIENNRIYIRTSGTKPKVGNRIVLNSLDELEIAADDYVCQWEGTCIPPMKKPLSNFLVQYAVSEITRKLGGDAPTEEAVLRKFEEQVRVTFSGRHRTSKVTRTNHLWAYPARRPKR